MKLTHYSLLLIGAFLILTAARPKLKKWDYFVYVPSGELKSESNSQSIQGFYMAATEVSNAHYRLFLQDLKKQNRSEDLKKAAVLKEKWLSKDAYMQPMAEQYSTNQAYNNYPVVNISYEAAQLYCQWLEEKLQSQSGLDGIKVRLPNASEWTYAARGGRDLSPYPWGGFYIKNSKQCYLLNMEAGEEDDGAWATSIVDAYFPNDYGLYNMSGNVAEMVQNKGVAMGGSWKTADYKQVQVDSKSNYKTADPTLGFRPVLSYTGPSSKKGFDPNKIWKKLAKSFSEI